MKIGIVSSSGGSVFSEVVNILKTLPGEKYEYCVVTDRECGIETFCDLNMIHRRRITEPDNGRFSHRAKEAFDEFGGVDLVILFFVRLVTDDLFHHYPTFNLHPSLLPAFKGFNPIRAALQEKVRFFGATLHLVNAAVDGGPIVGQACMPMAQDYTEEMLNRFSFAQKVYLVLLLIELFETGAIKMINGNSDFALSGDVPFNPYYNPAIRSKGMLDLFLEMKKRELGEEIFEKDSDLAAHVLPLGRGI